MGLKGKGFFIWKIPSCENGNAESIATQAAAAKFSHVLIKIADGTSYSNYDSTKNLDYIPPVITALKKRGIQVWGWHYIYGSDATREAKTAVNRIKGLNLDGYVIDAEMQFEYSGKDVTAKTFMTEYRKGLPTFPTALSTFRYPSYHSKFPFKAFLDRCDFSMPQCYWEQAHNPEAQLLKCLSEYRAMAPTKPILPTGPTYKVGSWSPTASDIKSFMNTAKAQNLPGVNFFSWDECRRDLNAIWTYIRDYQWPAPTVEEFHTRFIAALNTRNVDTIAAFYNSAAVFITSSRAIQGIESIKTYYTSLFSQLLPNAVFSLSSATGTGATRHISWIATSSRGKVSNGSDTFGLISDKIIYHYSFYKIT